jgi:UDP-N-acetylmuramoyl-tripeptide--D-alanyl-D-alanine ligase
MMDLWSTPKGRSHFINLFTVIQLLLLLFLWVSRYHQVFIPYAGYAIATVFLAESLQFLLELFTRKFRRPKPTVKAILIFFLTFFITCGAALFFLQWNFLNPDYYRLLLVLLVFSLLLSDINGLVIFLFAPLTLRAKRRVYDQALKKRDLLKNVKVIGITGSYGKTTTKEFLSTILSEKFNVLATEGNVNTEIGVANTILNNLKDEHEVFIVEMGAYRKGEIRTICDYARPDIGILTGINEQHVGLFGSLERTMEAKFELIESLPSKGLAVFNGDNEYCVSLAKGVKTPKKLYSIEGGSDVYASDIKVKPDGVSFLLCVGDESINVTAPITGRHNILNILACVCVGEKLDMTLSEMKVGIGKLSMPNRTLQVKRKGDTVVLDDTYNTNTDGIKSALQYMHEGFSDHKKIVVFPGILELGAQSEEIHVLVGTEIGKNADLFIISHTDFAKPLTRGARLGGMDSDQIRVLMDPVKVLAKIKSLKGNKVVLFESRGMESVMKKLI